MPDVGIWDPLPLAVFGKGKRRVRVIKAGGKSFRFQVHTLGHVRQPRMHRFAKDTETDAAGFEMRSDLTTRKGRPR